MKIRSVRRCSLKVEWGKNVWADTPCAFTYGEAMQKWSPFKYADIPADSVLVPLGVCKEGSKGLGVAALEDIREGQRVCYLVGTVSIR
jgi:hypothetical protein